MAEYFQGFPPGWTLKKDKRLSGCIYYSWSASVVIFSYCDHLNKTFQVNLKKAKCFFSSYAVHSLGRYCCDLKRSNLNSPYTNHWTKAVLSQRVHIACQPAEHHYSCHPIWSLPSGEGGLLGRQAIKQIYSWKQTGEDPEASCQNRAHHKQWLKATGMPSINDLLTKACHKHFS